ncbi:hypothetical protein BCR44DRAFT_36343, partial [Catenaria anguillulae PL171]
AGDLILQEDFLGDKMCDRLRVYSHLRTCIDEATANVVLPKADTALLHPLDFKTYKQWIKLQRNNGGFLLAANTQDRHQLLERDSGADWLHDINYGRKMYDLGSLEGGCKLLTAFEELARKRARGETARGVTIPPSGAYIVDEHMQMLERAKITAAKRKAVSEEHARNRERKAAQRPAPSRAHAEAFSPSLRLDDSGTFKVPHPPRSSAAAAAAPTARLDPLSAAATGTAAARTKDKGKGKAKATGMAADIGDLAAPQSAKAVSLPNFLASPSDFPELALPFDINLDGLMFASSSSSSSLFASSSSSASPPASTSTPSSLFPSSSFPLA